MLPEMMRELLPIGMNAMLLYHATMEIISLTNIEALR